MRILVDENIPRMTVAALREAGHDVLDLREVSQGGVSDEEVWGRAQAEGRILISTDRSFSRRRFEGHAGVLVVRLRQPNRQRTHDRVMTMIHRVPEREWSGLVVNARDHTVSVWRPRRR